MTQENKLELSAQEVETFLTECQSEIKLLEESLTKLKDLKIKLEEKKNKLKPFFVDIEPDLKRLNEEDYERLDVEMELNKLEQERRKDV